MKKTQVVLVDDIDGGAADDTISFTFKGISYEIDLSAAHAEEMAADFAKWISSARRVAARAGRARAAKKGQSKDSVVREWAKSNGIAVNDRGRVNTEVLAAYEAANA